MEVVGGIASVVGIIHVATKVTKLCKDYIQDAKGAETDIQALLRQVEDLQNLLGEVDELLKGPHRGRLSTSQKLQDTLTKCKNELTSLSTRLDPAPTASQTPPPKKDLKAKFHSRFFKSQSSISLDRRLRWPLEKSEVVATLSSLERAEKVIHSALQIDGIKNILSLEDETMLNSIPEAKGATFRSFENQHDPTCHPETRKDLLAEIEKWSESKKSLDESVFWISGAAGTGKSTIARTMAEKFSNKGILGASFFFRRGEADRVSASKLVSTLTKDLLKLIPQLAPIISLEIKRDSSIFGKGLMEQLDKLICQPLLNLNAKYLQRGILVIDALDECEDERDTRNIVKGLGRIAELPNVDLRIFITSRREPMIKFGFEKISGVFRELVLHETERSQIEADILTFLESEFRRIRIEHRYGHSLASDWPGAATIKDLVGIASPLFIVAATICRYVDSERFLPNKRLEEILKDRETLLDADPERSLDLTYLQILNKSLEGTNKSQRQTVVAEFHDIVGTIVVLESTLSPKAIANIIDVDMDILTCRLDSYHSIIQVPQDMEAPIKVFHLSFREFLLHSETKAKTELWIDGPIAHQKLSEWCIRLMKKSLKKDICDVQDPGVVIWEISEDKISQHIPPELEYACRYWIRHLVKGQNFDCAAVYQFLKEFLLVWLEVTSLLGTFSSLIHELVELESMALQQNQGLFLVYFVRDIKRFIRFHYGTIRESPLQIYSSALVFSPENSLIRQTFLSTYLGAVHSPPSLEDQWGPLLQTLDCGHVARNSISFSGDGNTVMLRNFNSIACWDTASGALEQWFKTGNSGSEAISPVESAALSFDGTIVASTTKELGLNLFDTLLSEQTVLPQTHIINCLEFSPDGAYLALGYNQGTVKILKTNSWETVSSIPGRYPKPQLIKYLSSGKYLALVYRGLYIILESTTGNIVTEESGNGLETVTFSPDDELLAYSAEYHVVTQRIVPGTFKLGERNHIQPNIRSITVVQFLSTDRLAAAGTRGSIEIWNIHSKVRLQKIVSPIGVIDALAFSLNHGVLASGGGLGGVLQLWDVTWPETVDEEVQENKNANLYISPNKDLLLSNSSIDGIINVWRVTTDKVVHAGKLAGHSSPVTNYSFTNDGLKFVSRASSGEYITWDLKNLEEIRRAYLPSLANPTFMAVSSDATLLASFEQQETGSWENDGTVNIIVWSLVAGEKVSQNKLPFPTYRTTALVFSLDDRYIMLRKYIKNKYCSRSMNDEDEGITQEEKLLHFIEIWELSSWEMIDSKSGTPFLEQDSLKQNRILELETYRGLHRFDVSRYEWQYDPCKRRVRKIGQWIEWNGRKVLRIPTSFMPAAEYGFAWDDNFALLHAGRVCLIQLGLYA